MYRLFFGSPGCGKTTLAVAMILKDRKRKHPQYDFHYANFNTSIARKCDLNALGEWTFPEHSYVACDESGVEYNSRMFKKLPAATMEYHKEHRHYKIDIDFFSQSWHDTDLVIRDLVEEVWHLKKIGPWTLCRRIKKRVDIDEEKHQPADMYYKVKLIKRFLPFPFNDFSFFVIFRPKYYKYFNTHERKDLPVVYFGPKEPDEPIERVNLAKGLQNVFTAILAKTDLYPQIEEENQQEQKEEIEQEKDNVQTKETELDLTDIGL